MKKMIKLVKSGANVTVCGIGSHENHYRESDTISIPDDWRPENYEAHMFEEQIEEPAYYAGYETGFQACLKALGGL